MRRVTTVVLLVGLLCAGMVGSAAAVNPTNGVYQGVVDGSTTTNGHNEGEGYIRAKGTASTKRIVPPGTFDCGGGTCDITAILAPSDFACNQLNARLEATKIPVSAGAFDYTGRANIGTAAARMHIRFKGVWKTQTRVKGFTRIWNKSCDSGKVPWTMNTPPP
jgi:hypothetical protein